MLRVEKLVKNYADFEALKGISFEIGNGKITGFLGRNGAGKSTTLNILNGIIDYQSGDIYFKDKLLGRNRLSVSGSFGYVPQQPVFYDNLTGGEYLDFIGRIAGIGKSELKAQKDRILRLIKLSDVAGKRIHKYSIGMKQRLAIGVSLLNNPEILFLDEPVSSLDAEGRYDVLNFIEELKLQGVTIMLSSHILNDIEKICDDVIIIEKGEIVIAQSLESLTKSYLKPVVDIEIDSNSEIVRKKLQELPSVAKLSSEGNIISVHVNDDTNANKEIIQLLAIEMVSLVSYNHRKTTLEDIFIRIIHGN
jgi:ABC-2 type transport system ATP-binding protein